MDVSEAGIGTEDEPEVRFPVITVEVTEDKPASGGGRPLTGNDMVPNEPTRTPLEHNPKRATDETQNTARRFADFRFLGSFGHSASSLSRAHLKRWLAHRQRPMTSLCCRVVERQLDWAREEDKGLVEIDGVTKDASEVGAEASNTRDKYKREGMCETRGNAEQSRRVDPRFRRSLSQLF